MPDNSLTNRPVALVKTRPEPRGLLERGIERGLYRVDRRVPGDESIAYLVEHFWTVRWSLDRPYLAETLPFPAVHAVIERGRSEIVGVMETKFSRTLTGTGAVLGIRFRPGGFRPFLDAPVRTITNSRLDLAELFGVEAAIIEERICAIEDFDEATDVLCTFIRDLSPPRDPTIERASFAVELVANNRDIVRVAQIEESMQMTSRALQRLFVEYVGVSPKWVINRYRLHEASEILAAGISDIATIAHHLHYFDQAHFTKDFKAVVGLAPTEFARRHAE